MDWVYHPGFIPDSISVTDNIYTELKPYFRKGYGSRYSCVICDIPITFYSQLNQIPWSVSPTLSQIRNQCQTNLGLSFDYSLIHIYPDGQANIAWHNDKEALNSHIASFSLGTPRKFRLRRKELTNGWDYEYTMNSGDLILMKPSCQQKWFHCVPKETTIKTFRMNLTFRQIEDRFLS